jgi:hypothetical protein
MAEQPAPPRFTAEGQPIQTGGRAGLHASRENDHERLRDAAAETSEYAEAHDGILGQAAEARQALGITDEQSLLSGATLREGEALEVNSLLNAAMNTAVARSVRGSTERLQTGMLTSEQRIGREVALAIESRVSELEEEAEPVPDFDAEAEAQLAEEQSDAAWLEDDADEDDGEIWEDEQEDDRY